MDFWGDVRLYVGFGFLIAAFLLALRLIWMVFSDKFVFYINVRDIDRDRK